MTVEASDVQGIVLKLWEKTLGIDGIGPTDDFFELGGNSITAIRMLPLVSEHLGLELDGLFVFDNPTPGEFAAAVTPLLGSG
jgi:hypothetical protein